MSRFSSIEADYLDPDKYGGWDNECEVCGIDPSDCECPVCPICNVQGDPRCSFEDGIFGGCNRDRMYEYYAELKLDRDESILK